MAEKTNEQIIADLLGEFDSHRKAVMKMIEDLETLQSSVDYLLPKKMDARSYRFFDEKVKAITEFFKTLLEMRKEIQKSLKEEIDLRRKINISETDEELERLIDVRGLAEKVSDFQSKRLEMQEQIIEKAQRETDQIASEIVTVQQSG